MRSHVDTFSVDQENKPKRSWRLRLLEKGLQGGKKEMEAASR